jgi:hypothetical protein
VSAETAGQATHDAWWKAAGLDTHPEYLPWDQVPPGQRAYWEAAAWAAWPVLAAQLAEVRGVLAEVRGVLEAFDWETDDRQYALEQIEQIVNGDGR